MLPTCLYTECPMKYLPNSWPLFVAFILVKYLAWIWFWICVLLWSQPFSVEHPCSCHVYTTSNWRLCTLGKFFGVCVGVGRVAHVANNGEYNHIRFYLQILWRQISLQEEERRRCFRSLYDLRRANFVPLSQLKRDRDYQRVRCTDTTLVTKNIYCGSPALFERKFSPDCPPIAHTSNTVIVNFVSLMSLPCIIAELRMLSKSKLTQL